MGKFGTCIFLFNEDKIKEKKGGFLSMTNLNQMEFNSIREIVAGHQTMAAKLGTYANNCSDTQIKQMFQQSATEATKNVQNLLQMI